MALEEFGNISCRHYESETALKFNNHSEHRLVAHPENGAAAVTWIHPQVYPKDAYSSCFSGGLGGFKDF
jgi:hypothetical protein